MRRFFYFSIIVLLLGVIPPSFAESSIDSSLTVTVARQTLHQVLVDIAQDIGDLKHSFSQLKEWDDASITPNRIRYQYAQCDLLIYTNDSPEFFNHVTELKVGVYLKLKASGERAEEFKDKVQSIVARRFEVIRRLSHNSY